MSTWRSTSRSAVAVLLALGIAGKSYAVGVGDISVKSALNQPLSAEIELLSVSSAERDRIMVSVAGRDVFDRMGIERLPVVDSLQFKVVNQPDGRDIIVVSTPAELHEPFLNFLIEVNWPTGRLLREFTVLLDPPKLTEEKAQTPQAPEAEAPPANVALAPPPPPPAPIPKPEAGLPPPPPVVVEEPKAPEQPVEAEVAAPVASMDLEYGPVESGDQLWRIAKKMRPSGVHVSQMMMALLRDNPEAFMGKNINRLKAGQVLRIKESSQVDAMSVEDAIAEVERQYQEFLTYRQGRLARNQATQLAADTKSTSGDDAEGARKGPATGTRREAKGTRLELVTPKAKPTAEQAESERAAAREKVKELDKMRGDLDQAASNLERMRKDNQNKKTQVSALEKQISDMQLLIALKDQELHLLQQRMREKGIDPEEGMFKGREETPLGQLDLSVGGEKRAPALDKNKDKNQAKPDAKNEPAKAADAKGKSGGLFGNPWFWLLLGAALVVTGVGFWWYGQRKSRPYVAELEDTHDPEGDAVVSPATPRTSPIVIDENAVVVDSATNSGVVTKHHNDPLSEAEVYLTYGRYQKAKEVLKSAIQADPDRHELKLKLLETYYFAEDRVGFETQAEELYAALGGQPGPLWDKAVELGQDLVPDHPLFRILGSSNMDETLVTRADKASPELAETVALGGDKAKRGGGAGEAVRPPVWAMERSEGARSRQQNLDETVIVPGASTAQDLVPAERSKPSIAQSIPASAADKRSDEAADAPPDQPVLSEEELLREEAEVRAMLEEAVSSYITAMEKNQAEETSPSLSGSSSTAKGSRTSRPGTPDEAVSTNALRATVENLDQDAQAQHAALEQQEPPASQASQTSAYSQYSQSRFAALQEAAADEDDQSIAESGASAPKELSTAYSLALLEEENPLPNGEEIGTITNGAADRSSPERPSAPSLSTHIRHEGEPVPTAAEIGLEDDLDEDTFFLFNDEVGTKLDLARAYIEMGDTEGAREILDEVMGEGNDKHKAEAQDLIRLVDKAVTSG